MRRQPSLLLMSGILVLTLCLVSGCSRKRSSILLDRKARGQLEHEREYGTRQVVYAYPTEQEKKTAGLEVTVQFYSMSELKDYFRRSEIFGKDAGVNPFYPQNIVFYVQIKNNSTQHVTLDPQQFFLVDNLGVQYSYLSMDYLNALADAKMGMGDATRMGLSKAPDVYGVDVGGFASGVIPKSHKRLAVLKQVSMHQGPIYPGVVYDGFVSFFRPHKDAKQARLLLNGFKTDHNANDVPQRKLEFEFTFDLVQAIVKESETEETPHAKETTPAPVTVSPIE